MRTRRLKNLDNVFLLGAGASYALSLPSTAKPLTTTAPLDKDFNSRILDLKSRKNWVKDAIKSFDTNWVGRSHLRNYGLEEAILKRAGNFDLLNAIHRTRIHDRRNSIVKCENSDYIKNLSHLIAEVLYNCRQNRQGAAKEFANLLFRDIYWVERGTGRRRRRRPTTRVITFNYDTILDSELIASGRIDEDSLYFDRLGKDEESACTVLDRRVRKQPFPLIVKLHGSINWRVKEESFTTVVEGTCDRSDRIPIWLDWGSTPSTNEPTCPLIVPPLPSKPITRSSIFCHLWQCALEYLHEAKRIIIVGYSCPATDSFAVSLLENIRNENLREVIVVDPDIAALKKYRSLLSGGIPDRVRWVYFDSLKAYMNANR